MDTLPSPVLLLRGQQVTAVKLEEGSMSSPLPI